MSYPLATCRRALREIREIAAVAHLEDSQMSDQEALRSISAIAEWVREVIAPGRGDADCGQAVRKLNVLLAPQDLDALDDPAAMALFDEVAAILETDPSPAVDQA